MVKVDHSMTRARATHQRDLRELIPKLGLREYWYPAILDKDVSWSKPVYRKLLGEDLCFFRGRSGKVVALADACPHRSAMLSHGECMFKGYITCFYHGFTYNEHGECVAALGEGPDSQMPGKIRARTYPTETLKGVVFVWMGEGNAVPIEEDIPPDFFEPKTLVLTWTNVWNCNWRPALENVVDSHFRVVHRNSLRVILLGIPPGSPRGRPPRLVGTSTLIPGVRGDSGTTEGRGPVGGGAVRRERRPYQDYYPLLGAKWPIHRWRLLWAWIFRPLEHGRNRRAFSTPPEWGGQRLPGLFRSNHGTFMFTRWAVPIDENHCHLFYFQSSQNENTLSRIYKTVYFHMFGNWYMNINFSQQDKRGAVEAYQDRQEYLSSSDIQTIEWRRLILRARGMNVEERQLEEVTESSTGV